MNEGGNKGGESEWNECAKRKAITIIILFTLSLHLFFPCSHSSPFFLALLFGIEFSSYIRDSCNRVFLFSSMKWNWNLFDQRVRKDKTNRNEK